MLTRRLKYETSAIGIRLKKFGQALRASPPFLSRANQLLFLCGANRSVGVPSARREAIKRFIEGLSDDYRVIYAEGVFNEAVDRRIGLKDPLVAAIGDSRDPRYITHPLRDLLTQRVFQIASGCEDGNDANALRQDPLFKLASGRAPLNTGNALACGATFSRLEASLRRRDIYRLARALVEQFVAGCPEAPRSITLDLDHTDDATYGQQTLSFYNHHYGHHCYLPLLVFEAESGALVSAVLRPGKRPTGAENAMIMKRVRGLLRRHWPQAHILLRGDGHFSNPELMALILADGNADFLFGLAGNPVLARQAGGLMKNARAHLALYQSLAAHG